MSKKKASLNNTEKITLDEALAEILSETLIKQIEDIEVVEADSEANESDPNLSVEFKQEKGAMNFKVEVRLPKSILLIILVIFSANIEGAEQILTQLFGLIL